jgi:hypothetical protein
MLSGAVIMIVRWQSARDGASWLTMLVPDGRKHNGSGHSEVVQR